MSIRNNGATIVFTVTLLAALFATLVAPRLF